MTEHFCQYLGHDDSGEYAGVFRAAGVEYDGSKPPCGKVARFICGGGRWWFCAEHYDLYAGYHGEWKAITEAE